jgi:hypothetical protein
MPILFAMFSGWCRVGRVRKERRAVLFWKNRTKKLLSIAGGAKLAILHPLLAAMSKSFLFLLFQKRSSSFPLIYMRR